MNTVNSATVIIAHKSFLSSFLSQLFDVFFLKKESPYSGDLWILRGLLVPEHAMFASVHTDRYVGNPIQLTRRDCCPLEPQEVQ